MAPTRLFYDPSAPRMLSQSEISQLNPSQIQAGCDQIDQSIVRVLQKIDEDFAKSVQILNERILPAVQVYGENSQQIWESVKFWKSFFEASANTKLSPEYGTDETFDASDPNLANNNGDESLVFNQSGATNDNSIATDLSDNEGTPRANTAGGTSTKWASEQSPYQTLKTELSQYTAGGASTLPKTAPRTGGHATTTTTAGAAAGKARYRLGDLSMDSPDVQMPTFEAYHDSTMNDSRHGEQGSSSTGIGRGAPPARQPVYDLSTGSPRSRMPKAGADKLHPQLLQKIMMKHLASPLPGSTQPRSSTPGDNRLSGIALPVSHSAVPRTNRVLFPQDLPKDWDGIANLSTARLESFASPSKPLSKAPRPIRSTKKLLAALSDEQPTDSPLQLAADSSLAMHYSPPRVKFGYTPSKDAARRIARETYGGASYAAADSPGLDPPSVLKNWATRGYDVAADPSPVLPLREGLRRGFEEEDDEDEDAQPFAMEKLGRTLPNFGEGAGTTAKIDDLLNEESFARIVDDDEDDLQHRKLFEEDEEEDGERLDEQEQVYYGDENEQEDRHFDEGEEDTEGIRRRDLRVGIEGPEDTLFGMRPNQPREDDSFDDEGAAGGGGFQLKGRINLADTQALDHHMQTDSPLAGRGAGL